MWLVERRRALEPRWKADLPEASQIPTILGGRFWRDPGVQATPAPGSTVAAPPAQQRCCTLDRAPIYLSFVRKAILWDRGLYHHTAHTNPNECPLFCPRFLSHMKACPKDLRQPCFLSSKPRPQPPSQGQTHRTPALSAPKTQTCGDSGSGVQNRGLTRGRRSTVVVPCTPVSPTPSRASTGSTIDPTPPPCNAPGRQGTKPNRATVSGLYLHPSLEEKGELQERDGGSPAASVTSSTPEPEREQCFVSDELDHSASPVPNGSEGSLSDFSRPPSSQFSRSTDLASGRSTALSDMREVNSFSSCSLSRLRSSSVVLTALACCSPGSPSHLSSDTVPQFNQPLPGQAQLPPPDPMPVVHPQSNPSLNSSKTSNMEPGQGSTEDLHPDPSVDPSLDPSLDPADIFTPASSSATWPSCPSQRTTPRSGSAAGARPTPSPMASYQDWSSHHWPVLPPISPVRDCSGTGASHCSEVSQSCVFDELEAIAPRSASWLSLDHPLSSAGCPSPDTELSPGLAALTVGCASGILGSLSRVHLLLLDRPEPEQAPSPLGQQFSPSQDWIGQRMPYSPEWTSEGIMRPLTAGLCGGDDRGSERCDSTGEVQGHTPAHTEGGSGSPSSWIIDPSPSGIVSRSSASPCQPNCNKESEGRGCTLLVPTAGNDRHTAFSAPDEGGHSEEEPNYPGCGERGGTSAGGRGRPGRLERSSMRRMERGMEERKTKVLDMFSKLQDSRPHQHRGTQSRSNFEDFDFLAKYCIFSQETLAEYKRAFEAVDSDGDGYISCLQVLLALKNIIPPDLLSDEEEIYVYRILEMVDFRVTDGLTDLRLFAVVASLAQKIATMDEFMRSLISNMDFRSLEMKLVKAKQLFLFLLEGQAGGAVDQQGLISADQLLLELKAGGIQPEQEAAARQELQRMRSLDLLGFLAYLPLFILIHNSVVANPLDDSNHL